MKKLKGKYRLFGSLKIASIIPLILGILIFISSPFVFICFDVADLNGKILLVPIVALMVISLNLIICLGIADKVENYIIIYRIKIKGKKVSDSEGLVYKDLRRKATQKNYAEEYLSTFRLIKTKTQNKKGTNEYTKKQYNKTGCIK